MNTRVLILSAWNDPHGAAVRWALEKNAVDTVMSPSLFTGDAARYSIWSSDQDTRLHSSHFAGDDTGFRSAWYRRPMFPEPVAQLEADREFISRQWRYFQRNVFDLGAQLGNTLWVNQPVPGMMAESKLVQLQAARAAGLTFPELVVTNDAADVRELIERHGRVVYKTFYPQSWQSASTGGIYSLGVVLLDAHSELPEQAIATCPGIFQRYIDKAYDVRVTIIGSKFFAVRMLKQNGEAYLDWRPSALAEETVMEPFELSQSMTDRLRDLMRRLDIVFGCVDLVVDRNGEAYFLEVNQAGQFLFVEERTRSLPLLRAITAMLSSGRTDYSLEDCAPVSFLDYLQTDDYRAVMESLQEEPLLAAIEP
ncbi:ATP-grasp domain-containing protein [Dyella acidiphila]|uniref:ATP-grasp domain-containing protein n=1 Tax=Dyella acidiphila TaxID=2775866 RepID=A0ABR9G771_9GAMM|nr:hypothetical protein [Dyella acidiphila]MBE1159886.1 hypothetical protein [Dyella acidiphila]